MSSLAAVPAVNEAVAMEVLAGLSSSPKTLSPWLFYDEAGSRLFEQITVLPEYYLTRTERDLFTRHAEEIFRELGPNLTVAELGAGTATKTEILLRTLTGLQPQVLYQPIDISPSALDEARDLQCSVPGVTVQPQVANYITDAVQIHRPAHAKVLALYIGSSIGNFSPADARSILVNLRAQLRPGDALLLGTDLAPSETKTVQTLIAAYDDAAGVTAAFNRNVLVRLNHELGADFDLGCFAHRARWNAAESRMEMHLESLCPQTVKIPTNSYSDAMTVRFGAGETMHTENSYKFTRAGLDSLLGQSCFRAMRTFSDDLGMYALTLATAI